MNRHPGVMNEFDLLAGLVLRTSETVISAAPELMFFTRERH